MIKDIQAVRQLLPTNCLSMFDLFLGLVLKGLRSAIQTPKKCVICLKLKGKTPELRQ